MPPYGAFVHVESLICIIYITDQYLAVQHFLPIIGRLLFFSDQQVVLLFVQKEKVSSFAPSLGTSIDLLYSLIEHISSLFSFGTRTN